MAAMRLQQDRTAEVRAVLATIRDPEIDETVAELDFILDVIVEGGEVEVKLRLPTYWCPVNFVWMMAWDMREAVRALPWVADCRLTLVDHFAETEVTRGLNAGQSFEAVFPQQARGGLGGLKRDFAAKSMLMRQGRLIAALRKAGMDGAAICAARLGDLEQMAGDAALRPLHVAVLEKRREAGLACSATEPAICDATGGAVSDLDAHLREIRRTGTNAAANGEMCRMLVATRRAGGPTCGAFAPRPRPETGQETPR